ncbi:unnamed protein product [Musa textilis]
MVTADHLALVFFSFAVGFALFSMLLLLLRKRRWCTCHVCRAYLSSSWAAEFDNLCDWHTHLLRESPTGTIHVHVLGNIITANPTNVEYMLKTRFDNFPKGKAFSALLGDLLGDGIFNVDGDSWLFQRKMASLALGSISVRSYALGIVSSEISRKLLPLLSSVADRRDGVVDLQDVFRRFAFDTICMISFGLDRSCLELSLPMSEFAAAFDAASKLLARRGTATASILWKLKRLFNVGSERKLNRAIRKINMLAEDIIRQRRRLGFTSGHDLLSRFMCLVGDDDKFLRDIVISFLLAGRDAVASGLTSFFLLLSQNPYTVAAMRDEIAGVIKDGNEDAVNYEQLKEMRYACGALREPAPLPTGTVRLKVLPRGRRAPGRHLREQEHEGDVPPVRHGADGDHMGTRLRGVQTGAVAPRRGVYAGEPIQLPGVPGRAEGVPREGAGAGGDEGCGRLRRQQVRRRGASGCPAAQVCARAHGYHQRRRVRSGEPAIVDPITSWAI